MARKLLRLGIAAVLAPIVGCVVGAQTFALIYASMSPSGLDGAVLFASVYGFAYGVTIGLIAMAVFGLPGHVLLSRLGWRHPLHYALLGALIGTLTSTAVIALVLFTSDGRYPNAATDTIKLLPLAATIGLSVGFVFWVLRRPDRDAANPPTPAP